MRARFFPRSLAGALGAAAVLCAVSTARPAAAQTTGRVGLTNDYSMMSGPDATIDAALLRIYMKSEHLGGKDLSLIVDLRSDLPILATTKQKYGAPFKGPFNGNCRGGTVANNDCSDLAIRNVSLGQLSELAGVYDLFLKIGDSGEGRTTYSIGRKTVYEAGLVTVDGLTVEHTFIQEVRAGAFIGLAPNPLTRMFNANYQTLGGYVAYTGFRYWIRFGASAMNYSGPNANKYTINPTTLSQPGTTKGVLAQANLFNQDFFKITKDVSGSAFIQFDPIPGEDRLEMIDVTYKPSTRYRVRLNVTRFRPLQLDQTPALINGNLLDPTLLGLYAGVSTSNRLAFRTPEVIPAAFRNKAITSAKVVGHYVTANSITPYASIEYRVRELDNKTALVPQFGAYTYDPYDSGIVARAFLEFQTGFDSNVIRFDGTFEREVISNVTLGGGLDASQVSYQLRIPSIEAGNTTGTTNGLLNFFARYDRQTGPSFFFEADYLLQQRKTAKGEFVPTTQGPRLPTSSTEISALLGITYRFGPGR
jgi:hypothetical protein